MLIHGLQKMTLLDFPGRVACTVFLGGCDFRCPFCHNFELATGEAKAVMDDRELLSFLRKRQGLLDGVAITGGEPCLHKGLPDLLARIRELGFLSKLDTNGYHPTMLANLIEEGLVDYVAMDIKNSPEKYARTCGMDRIDMGPIRESIDILKEAAPDYEFRTTVVAELHEPSDFHAMGRLIEGAKRYFLQAFTDRDTVPFEGFSAPPQDVLESYVEIAQSHVATACLRGID